MPLMMMNLCNKFSVLTANLIVSTNTFTKDEWTKISQTIAPVLRSFVSVGSKQCEIVKHMLGLTYDQMKERNAPNAEQILIEVITENTEKRNLSTTELVNQETVVIIHGFMESTRGDMVSHLSKAFLEKGYNVLAVDGGQLLSMMYFRSTSYVRFIGEELGRVLAELHKESKLDPGRVHLIGHSLGAHIAGVAGKQFFSLTGVKLARITALDPAGPCFDTEAAWSVRSGDATFVDVIHTDAGFLGAMEPIGDQDYYPNGGWLQPGCSLSPCSHSRSWMLFVESVKTGNVFLAQKCDDWEAYKNDRCDSITSYMGLDAVATSPGPYYLYTTASPPYWDFGLYVVD